MVLPKGPVIKNRDIQGIGEEAEPGLGAQPRPVEVVANEETDEHQRDHGPAAGKHAEPQHPTKRHHTAQQQPAVRCCVAAFHPA